MKSSRKFVMVLAGVVAMFSGGAILGSYMPESTDLYVLVTVAAVAAAALIFFGFTGYEVERKVVETTKKPQTKKERKVADEDPYEDISSGRR